MLIRLAISWICVGIFAATAVITLLALVRIVKLADRKYLDRLFGVLIVEVVVISVGVFSGFVDSPGTVEEQIKQEGRQEFALEWLPRLEANQQLVRRLSDPSATLSVMDKRKLATAFQKYSATLDSVATMKPH